MKKTILVSATIALASMLAQANDGGIAAIKVDQIKMRETAIKNGEEVLVRKIANPRFTITIEGGEAKKLQQILPSQVSVITAINPKIEKDYNESFKALGVYSLKSKNATSKGLLISCSDATLSEDGAKVTKTGKSVCTIEIQGFDEVEGVYPGDMFGDSPEFKPKSCK